MEYQTVYDFGVETIKIGGMAFIVLFIAVGCGIAWNGYKQKSGDGDKNDLVGGLVMALFALFFALFTIPQNFISYFNTKAIYRHQHYQRVEGTVDNFDPMPYGGHRDEHFTVQGIRFSYSDYDQMYYYGFNNTASHGGPIQQGIPVRISYFTKEKRNIILKIEVPQTSLSPKSATRVRLIQWRTVFASRLPLLGAILCVIVVLSGVLGGCSQAWRNLFGREGNDAVPQISSIPFQKSGTKYVDLLSLIAEKTSHVKAFSDTLLCGGFGCLIGGLLWVGLEFFVTIRDVAFVYGILLGGLTGLLYRSGKKWATPPPSSDEPIYPDFVIGGGFGLLASGVGNAGMWMVALFLGGVAQGMSDILTALSLSGIVGIVLGGCAGLVGTPYLADIEKPAYRLVGRLIGALSGVSAGVFMTGIYWNMNLLDGVVLGIIGAGGLVGLGAFVIPAVATGLTSLVARLVVSAWSGCVFKTAICQGCLQAVPPAQSAYDNGIRYCPHCQQEIKKSGHFRTLRFVLGKNFAKPQKATLVVVNPSVHMLTHAVDVSEIYIHTQTCQLQHLEQCITYLLNFPPRRGLASIRVRYEGSLDELGANLNNTLHNTFRHIKRIGG